MAYAKIREIGSQVLPGNPIRFGFDEIHLDMPGSNSGRFDHGDSRQKKPERRILEKIPEIWRITK